MVVTLKYQVTDSDGLTVDAGNAPLVYLHGGHDDIFPKIEEAIHGKKIGDTVSVKLQPDEAFGDYDENLIEVEPRSAFPETLEVGMQFEGAPEDADEDDFIIYRVTDIADDKVVLDGNHPLAGMALIFTCTVIEMRAASADELREGCVAEDGAAGSITLH